MSEIIQRELRNGLRVCLEPADHLPSAAVGLLVRTGSRDEGPGEEGGSHFLEHLCFKGSARLSAQELNQGIDRLGSYFDAATSHEETIYHGWLPPENVPAQLALLGEMMRSVLPAEEVELERQVILEEIAEHYDEQEDVLLELALGRAFAGSPLEHSVLGTEETIEAMTREQLLAYHARRYGPENMLFIATGRLDPPALVAELERLTADWPAGESGRVQAAPRVRTGVVKEVTDRFTQQGLVLAFPAPAGRADDLRVLFVESVLTGFNSRLFWELRQKDICPEVDAFYMPFSDVGLFVFSAQCEPERAEGALAALREQAERLTREGPTAAEVERVKHRLRTELATEADSPVGRFTQLADNLHLVGKAPTLAEDAARLEAITVRDVCALLEEYPLTGEGLLVSTGPVDWP